MIYGSCSSECKELEDQLAEAMESICVMEKESAVNAEALRKATEQLNVSRIIYKLNFIL